MSVLIVDASATLPWCFVDEATDWSKALINRLRTTDQAIVPCHWPNEVSNGLLMAYRRQRIPWRDVSDFWNDLAELPITVEPPITPDRAKSILALCEQHRLTFYDATYLELAQRLALPLATLDDDLIKAARSAHIELIA